MRLDHHYRIKETKFMLGDWLFMHDDHEVVYACHVDEEFDGQYVYPILDKMREHLPKLHRKYEFEPVKKIRAYMNKLME